MGAWMGAWKDEWMVHYKGCLNVVSRGTAGYVCVRYPTDAVHCVAKKKFYLVPLGVVVVVVHIIFPDEPEKISFLLAVDFCHAPQSVWENALAPLNMACM